MKNLKFILIAVCFLLAGSSSYAQDDINVKRKLAFDAFENEEHELVVNILKDLKPQFRSWPVNLLGIEILSKYELIKKEPYRDYALLADTRDLVTQYLENPISEKDTYFKEIIETKYRLQSYPVDKESFAAKLQELERIEEENKIKIAQRAEEFRLQKLEEEAERLASIEAAKVQAEKDRIEAEKRKKEREALEAERREREALLAEENRIERAKREKEQEKIRKRNERKYRFRNQTFSNFGIISGEIARYGLLYETGGGNNAFGFRMSVRSSLVPEKDILSGKALENKTEFDLGPTIKLAPAFYLNLGGGYGFTNFVDEENSWTEPGVQMREYFTGSAGLMIRLSRVISISGGASFMDIDQENYTPEYTVGLSFNLKGKYQS